MGAATTPERMTMSANNWAQCPRCRQNGIKELRSRQQKVADAYGKVPEHEYLEMKEWAKQPVSFPSESLREDYELRIDPATWTFKVSYQAHCDECGFSFKFEHSEVATK
jgi:hypothetical protein